MIKNILILEDEQPNADRLRRLLGILRPEVKILAVLDSSKGAVEWLSAHESPDLILMDVRLADGLSFDIFHQVRIDAPVVFTTAYDEYAVRAFKYNGVDYLLKPIEQDELEAALDKVDKRMEPTIQPVPAIETLLNYLQPKDYRTRFLLPFRDSYKIVPVKDIAFFYSETKITHARLYNGTTDIVPQSMEELETQLDPKLYFRCNRQYIVHIDAVQNIHNYFNGKLKLGLKGFPDEDIVVSREKAPILKSWIGY